MVYATQGVVSINATILQKYGGVGDHHCFIVDFTSESVLGGVFPRIVAPSKRKLHCDCKRIQNNYNLVLNDLTNRHQPFKKLNDLDAITKMVTKVELQLYMNRWDNELTENMNASEKKCHKFKQDQVEYSPEMVLWWKRRWLLEQVRRYLRGKYKIHVI